MENESQSFPQSFPQSLKPGQQVRFRLRDVHLPSIQDVLNRMTPETELQGSITLLSSEGAKKAAFAVVEVKGILMPIIVPTARVAAGIEEAASAKV